MSVVRARHTRLCVDRMNKGAVHHRPNAISGAGHTCNVARAAAAGQDHRSGSARDAVLDLLQRDPPPPGC